MNLLGEILTAAVFILRNFFGLIFYPYKTVRQIAKENDHWQIIIIFLLVYSYFIFANIVRHKTLPPLIISSSSLTSFSFFIVTFILATGFFYGIARLQKKPVAYQPLIFTFAYSLFPTLIWFFTTSWLYFLLPPPRTISLLGQSFSLIFVIFSIAMLGWRLMLFYLSLRFSLKSDFYNLMFLIVLFLLWFLPYSYVMYYLHIFRVPFI